MTSARDRVTTTALGMFSERGFASVSMRDLARELGIQAPSLYSHYPSKDALLEATIAPLLDALDTLIAQAPTPPVSDNQRREWLAGYLQLVVRERVALRVAVSDRAVASRPQIGERLRQQSVLLRKVLATLGAPDDLTGAAVIGHLCWPSLWLPETLTDAQQARLVESAVAMLNTTGQRTVTSG